MSERGGHVSIGTWGQESTFPPDAYPRVSSYSKRCWETAEEGLRGGGMLASEIALELFCDRPVLVWLFVSGEGGGKVMLYT